MPETATNKTKINIRKCGLYLTAAYGKADDRVTGGKFALNSSYNPYELLMAAAWHLAKNAPEPQKSSTSHVAMSKT